MKVLRRRVRRSFLLAAIGFLIVGFAGIVRQDYSGSALRHFGFAAFCLAQGAIYAAAWFSTKAPSPYRNNWAIIGSLFTLAWAGYDLWLHHTDLLSARGGLICLVMAIAGLYVFGQGGSPVQPGTAAPETSAASARLDAAILGEPQLGLAPAAERIARVYKIPAEKIPAEPSASSAALALAAVSPSDPTDAPWDPVSFLRSSRSGN